MRRNLVVAIVAMAGLVAEFSVAGRFTVAQEKAADKVAPAVKAKVADLSWMSGVWRGKDEKSEYEETWSGVANGSIIGMFRTGAADKTSFFEFETLTQEGEEVALRIRHYREKMVDAEAAPMVWSVAKIGPNEVAFESQGEGFVRRLQYRREGDNLTAQVETQREGKAMKLEFKMSRVR